MDNAGVEQRRDIAKQAIEYMTIVYEDHLMYEENITIKDLDIFIDKIKIYLGNMIM